jgi:hypothetical protein
MMRELSAILRSGSDDRLLFWCPGCNMAHGIKHGSGSGPRWTWNGDVAKPTFKPSILVRWSVPAPREPDDPPDKICHSFVTDGMIQFLGDCTHALAGQTVPLPVWDYGQRELGL